MDGPIDYLSGLGTLADPLGEIQKQLAFRVGLSRQQAETQQAAAEAAQVAQKLSRAQMFQQDLGAVQANPSPGNVSSLMMKYPEFADQVKGAWDLKDKAQTDADLTSIGQVYTPALSGDWATAQKAAHARYDADKAAGQTTPDDDQFIQQVDAAASGDKQAQKTVLASLGFHAAAAAGADHFATVFGALNKGDFTLDAGATRYDASGNPIVQSPYLKGADGGILERDAPSGPAAEQGAAPASAQSAAAPGGDQGFDKAIDFTLRHEGGFNPHDMNGAPVNFGINQAANPGVDVRNLTKDEATQIYKTKYWDQSGAANLPAAMQTPYFDTYIINPSRAQQFLKASGGDPGKFMQLRENWMDGVAAKNPQYAKAYATRNADLRLTVEGQSQAPDGSAEAAPSTGGAPPAPPGYHWAVPPKQQPAPNNGALDPETTNFYAQEVLAGTPMSQLGFGFGKAAQAARQQVMSQVAKMAAAEGLGGRDLAIQIAHYKAGMSNVQNLEKQLGTIQGNEATFAANAQQVIARSQELPAQTGSRILNTPIQTYLRQTNDPTVAALDVAIKTAANEYARLVTASPSGAGALTDSARQEYQDILQGNFPLKQKLAALQQMQRDAANRTASLKTNLQDAYRHLTDRAPELRGDNSGASDIPKGARVIGTSHGRRVIQLANGQRMVEQ